MSTHSFHPDTHENGLADECERCTELAANPFELLDDLNLRTLLFRVREDLPPRSANEWRAMEVIERALRYHKRLAQIEGRTDP